MNAGITELGRKQAFISKKSLGVKLMKCLTVAADIPPVFFSCQTMSGFGYPCTLHLSSNDAS